MPAILTLTYTPNYPGNHRVCFRTTQPSYCCYTDDSTSFVGTPKTIEIDLEDFELCLQDLPVEVGCAGSIVEGYIQPLCIEQGSDVNRIAFTATFPSTPCAPYEILCVESGIGEIGVINPGYGWPIGVVPTVTVNTSGSGFGFASTVTMSCLPGDSFCSIGSVVIDNSGEEYFYLNQLSIDVSPLPSCEGSELVIDGTFLNGLADWTVDPFPNGWEIPTGEPIYNLTTYGPAGGTLSQDILEDGKTYLITIQKAQVGSVNELVRFIITAGTFDITGTEPNQYMITRTTGDTDYDGPITVTLTCVGSTTFSIYADSLLTDPGNKATFNNVSVIEVCEAINPELEISFLDDCSTFTIPNCDGSDNTTEYQIQGTQPYAINVCSGGAGPVGPKYTITPNPTYEELGPELVVNGVMPTDLNGWTISNNAGPQPDFEWDPLFDGSAKYISADAGGLLSQDILTVGVTYDISFDIYMNVADGLCNSQLTVSAGTSNAGVFSIPNSTIQGYECQLTCTGNSTFSIFMLDQGSCPTDPPFSYRYLKNISVKESAVQVPVSCCDCVKYDIINTALTDAIEFYYTDCTTQVITTQSIDAQQTLEICAVRNSIWPADPNDNQYLEYILSGIQDC